MSKLVILGAGGHGLVVGEAAMLTRCWTDICFFDDRYPELKSVGPWQVTGTLNSIDGLIARENTCAMVAVGEAGTRLVLLSRLHALGIRIASVIHPASTTSKLAAVGDGSAVLAGAVINAGANLGEGCIVNTLASIDHGCVLGKAVHIAPGAHLAADVNVGECSWIGIGASVREGVTIGKGVTVGAGAAVVSDLPDGVVAVGVPARPISP